MGKYKISSGSLRVISECGGSYLSCTKEEYFVDCSWQAEMKVSDYNQKRLQPLAKEACFSTLTFMVRNCQTERVIF